MDVVVDGLIYEAQARGGISRLFSEILPRMCELESSLLVTLLTVGRLRQPIPAHPRIRHRPLLAADHWLRPSRVWRPVIPRVRAWVQQVWLGHSTGKLWHSTYYTMLPKWEGPVVVTVHDMIYERFAHLFNGRSDHWFRQQKRRCVLAADVVICVSETTAQDVQQFYGLDRDRMKVVPHAHSPIFRLLERSDKVGVSPTTKPFLLYVGGRGHYKNFAGFLRAYSLWPRRREVDIVVAGPPWSKDEHQALIRQDLAGQVHCVGQVDDEALCRLYNQAVAFVYPSLHEGFGIPLLEAMACGCPVVASRIPSALGVAGDCPVYFDPSDPLSFVTALERAVSEGRTAVRVRCGLDHTQHYSWNETARQTLDVYRSLLD